MSGKLAVLAPDSSEMEIFRKHVPEGVEPTWVDSNLPPEEQAAQLQGAVAIIGVVSVEVARQCPRLRLVQTFSAGTDRFDIQALGELGIRVANNGGGNAIAVSEHAIALMLSVYRKLDLQFETAKAGHWARDLRARWTGQAHEIAGKTVGIVGLGYIGQEVARRLQGWGCEITYHDAISRPSELEEELHVTRASIDDLLRSSDIVTLHVPLTRLTRRMIGERELDLMKPTAVLINTCRGGVVDEPALVKALEGGQIGGAGLDVLEKEPPPADNPLLKMDNVVVTPHMGAFAQESQERARAFAVQNAARVVQGQEPQSIVLPE